jgi:hypothetical protein
LRTAGEKQPAGSLNRGRAALLRAQSLASY